MKVQKLEAIRTEYTTDITVVHKDIPYRFRATVMESEKCKIVKDIEFRDKHEILLKKSFKNKLKRKIVKYFLED